MVWPNKNNFSNQKSHIGFGKHLISFTMKRRRSTSTSTSEDDKPYCFFKLMLSPITQPKKLRVPEMFARAFGDELSTACILTVPSGETRKVGLLEEDNRLWFHDGWQEFVEYFSIGFGYFMLFKYQGNSNFKVHIFDLSACEISYQHNAQSNSRVKEEPCQGDLSPGVSCKEELDDDDVQASDENLHPLSTSSGNPEIEVIEVDGEDEELKPHKGSEYETKTNDDAREDTSLGSPIWLRNYEGVLNAVSAAGISIPENPFFVALIRSYVLYEGRFLYVPMPFARKHLKCKAGDTIMVEMYDGRQWAVRCCRDSRTCSLGKGWIIFAREIGLEIGDVCVLELTDAKNTVLRVQVVKKSQIKDACKKSYQHNAPSSSPVENEPCQGDLSPEVSCKEELDYDDVVDNVSVESLHSVSTNSRDSDTEIIELDWRDAREGTSLGYPIWLRNYEGVIKAASAAGISIPENPFFVAVIKSYALHKGHFLYVPLSFARKHLKCKTGETLQVETYDGRQWAVRCCRDRTRCTLSKGWIILAREIGLQIGDTCIFELICAQNNLLRVQVVKKSQMKDACKISYQHNAPSSSPVENESCHPDLSTGVSYKEKLDDDDSCASVESLLPSDSDIEVIELDSEDEEMKPHEGSEYSTKTSDDAREGASLGCPNWLRDYEGLIKAVAAAGISTPENPFFVALIRPYCLDRSYFLRVPTGFAREHIRCKSGDAITVETYEGKQCTVQFRRDNAACTLGKGWIVLARELGLEVGDVCVFELTDAQNSLLRVQVAKKSQIKAAGQMV